MQFMEKNKSAAAQKLLIFISFLLELLLCGKVMGFEIVGPSPNVWS